MPNLSQPRGRVELELELAKSIVNEKRLRAQLTELEASAAALRASRSTLLDTHADEMMRVRGELTLACRRSTTLRTKLRAMDLL